MPRFIAAVRDGLTNRELAARFGIAEQTASKLAAPLRGSTRRRA